MLLVVDDEEPVREFTSRILTSHGYRVISARDGAQAVAVFAPRAAEVRLVLSDSDMPILGGAVMAAAMRRIKPELPIIAMSGADEASDVGKKGFASAFIAKPFQVDTLLSIVRRTLDATASLKPAQPST